MVVDAEMPGDRGDRDGTVLHADRFDRDALVHGGRGRSELDLERQSSQGSQSLGGSQRLPELPQVRELDRRHPCPQDRVRPGEALQAGRSSQGVYPGPQLRKVDGLDQGHSGSDRMVGAARINRPGRSP